MPATGFSVNVAFTVKNPDGTDFYSSPHQWSNVSQPALQAMMKVLNKSLGDMIALGDSGRTHQSDK